MEQTKQRQEISQVAFDKKVDEEYAYLTWQERMDGREARQEAVKRVSAEYVVQRSQ